MMKKYYALISKWILAHKVAAAALLVVVLGGGYYAYARQQGAPAPTRYVLAAAQKGMLIVSVSGRGQIAASDQVDVKPKTSGEITSLAVKEGQKIGAGAVIARIDSADAQKAVRDAEANLTSAKIALEKVQKPADNLTILQAQNAVATASSSLAKLTLNQQTDYSKAQDALRQAQDDLRKAYDSGFNSTANAFLDLPPVITGLDSILNGYTVNGGQVNAYAYYDMIKSTKSNAEEFRDAALKSYVAARDAYDKNLSDYRAATPDSDPAAIEALINETYSTAKLIAEAVKDTKNFLDLVNDAFTSTSIQNSKPPAILATHEASLLTYTGTANSHVVDLLSVENAIQAAKESANNATKDLATMGQSNPLDVAAAQAALKEKETSLAQLMAGADTLDVRSAELTVQQRQNALADAEQTLSDYAVRAPFAGVIAKLNAAKGDTASPGTAVATLITSQRIAEISLNEVDIAKIKLGDKATLTFDAVSDLTISGTVADIDALGTVTQGVVTYTVKIGFDTQDPRIKPSMSVSAAIITDTKQDALLVPNSAVKSQGGVSYVEELPNLPANATSSAQGIPSDAAPARVQVEVGLQSDSQTEITSGLQEGEQVIVRTITASSAQSGAAAGGSGLRIPGVTGGGGGVGGTRTGGAAIGR